MNIPRLSAAALAVALVGLVSGGGVPARSGGRLALGAQDADDIPLRTEPDPAGAVRPTTILGNGSDVRALALTADGAFVWAATSGGLDRYTLPSLERRSFGPADGLDTLDVRAVVARPDGRVIVQTAESRCALHGDRLGCIAAHPPAPDLPRDETFEGALVTARLATAAGDFVGTRGAGLWLAHDGVEPRALPITAAAREAAVPRSFVRKVVFYKDRAYVATFDDGLLAVEADAPTLEQHPEMLARAGHTGAPPRMINDVATDGTTLWVAAAEGLFWTRDGVTFQRFDRIEQRAVTSLAFDAGGRLYATTNAALWRITFPSAHRSPRVEANWWRPAGTRSLQSVAVSAGAVFLGSEDRGVIAFDGQSKFTAFDKLAGLPTSWIVALAGDERGGAWAATLRDGVLHVDGHGGWSKLAGVPSDWTLDVTSEGGTTCVGTQRGAACWDDPTKPPSRVLVGLPDHRVHDVQRLGQGLFVGTEAGAAVFARDAS